MDGRSYRAWNEHMCTETAYRFRKVLGLLKIIYEHCRLGCSNSRCETATCDPSGSSTIRGTLMSEVGHFYSYSLKNTLLAFTGLANWLQRYVAQLAAPAHPVHSLQPVSAHIYLSAAT